MHFSPLPLPSPLDCGVSQSTLISAQSPINQACQGITDNNDEEDEDGDEESWLYKLSLVCDFPFS